MEEVPEGDEPVNRVLNTMFLFAAGLLLGGAPASAASADAARFAGAGSEIRFPVIEGNSASSKRDPSSPPEIPVSIADEVPGKSPGAVSGFWITIFEIDLDPIAAGKLNDAEAPPAEPPPPDAAEQF